VKAQTATAVVPDAQVRAGNFSNRPDANGNLTPIFDPATTRANPGFNPAQAESPANPRYLRDLFPGNIIPTNRLDPVATAVLAYVDLPNLGSLPFSLGRFLNNESIRQTNDQFSVRVDHSLTAKDQLFGRYSFSEEFLFSPKSACASPGGCSRGTNISRWLSFLSRA